MSLFVCEQCGTIDNTALTDFWMRRHREGTNDQRALCSACLTGKWHGRFPQETYDGTQNVQYVEGRRVDGR